MTVGGEQDRESEPGKKSQKQRGKKPGEEEAKLVQGQRASTQR